MDQPKNQEGRGGYRGGRGGRRRRERGGGSSRGDRGGGRGRGSYDRGGVLLHPRGTSHVAQLQGRRAQEAALQKEEAETWPATDNWW